MKYDFAIWDFNGTIVDDVGIGIDSVNVLLKRRNLKTLDSREEYHRAFGFPIVEYYGRLGFDFEKESYDDIAVEWVKEYTAREYTAPLVDGVRDVIEYFSGIGTKQVIISASEGQMLERMLANLGVGKFFSEVAGNDNIYAVGKTAIALEWRKRHPDESLVFIGDTDHDAEVAEAIGAECVLVAAGHQSFEHLSKIRGVTVYGTMSELLGYLRSCNH